MSTRDALHAVVDDLDDAKLELAKQALEEIRDDTFELTPEEERELLDREAECDAGPTIDARAFLADLQGRTNSQG